MHVEIPEEVRENAISLRDIVGDSIWEQFPTVDTLRQASETTEDMIVAMNWEPTLSIIGADGIPSVQDAGNVLRTNTDLKLSFRIPLGSIRSMLQLVQRKSWRRTPHMGQRSHSLLTHVPMVSMHRH